jgi:phage recombination protein Bet
MTETTAAEATAGPDLVDDAEKAAEHAESASLAVIRPEQQRFDDNQKAILRQLGIEDATDGDLDLFFHVCRTTGLDPFRKQIYMIGRNTKVSEWVDDDRAQNGRRKVDRWVTKYTIQVGIDGYRRNVRETAKALGDTLRLEGPWYTAEDDFHITEDGEVIQHWRKVWPHKSAPWAARFLVIRNGEEFEGIAHFAEFVQTNYNGEPNTMWAKMPRNQIAKCAESLAYRRAYPDDLSGLILEDAAQPMVLDEDGNVISEGRPVRQKTPGPAPITVEEILSDEPAPEAAQAPAPTPEPVESRVSTEQLAEEEPAEAPAQPVEPPPAAAETPEAVAPETAPETAPVDEEVPAGLNETKVKQMFALLGEGGIRARTDRLIIFRKLADRADINSTNDLTTRDLNKIVAKLKGYSDAKTIVDDLAEIIWDAAQAEATAPAENNEEN